MLGFFLLILAVLLYAGARRRAMSSDHLRPSAGCPACQEATLIRISRRQSDRNLSKLSSVPMGRFVCPKCRWEGRRVIRKSTRSRERKEREALTAPASSPNMGDIESANKQQETAVIPAIGAGKVAGHTPDSLDGAGFQLTDKWSNQVITVRGEVDGKGADLGEFVGTLHVQVWRNSGSDDTLEAYLDHSSTTVTIYKRVKEPEETHP